MNRAIIAVIASLILCSCGASKPTVVYRDSIKVEYRDRIIRDTVSFDVPVEVEKIVTRDTTSHLENSLAESDAVVSGGFLHHSLNTKPQTIQVPIVLEVHDTIIVEKNASETIKEVEIEKPLSWWQKLKMGAFWWLILACVVGFRKEIAKLIKLVM